MCCVQVGVAFDPNRTGSRSPNLMSTKTFFERKRPRLCALLAPIEYKIPASWASASRRLVPKGKP